MVSEHKASYALEGLLLYEKEWRSSTMHNAKSEGNIEEKETQLKEWIVQGNMGKLAQ